MRAGEGFEKNGFYDGTCLSSALILMVFPHLQSSVDLPSFKKKICLCAHSGAVCAHTGYWRMPGARKCDSDLRHIFTTNALACGMAIKANARHLRPFVKRPH